MKHGAVQVKNMIKDRPLLGLLIKEGDEVFNWMAEQFEHKIDGHPIFWSPEDIGYIITFPADGNPAYFGLIVDDDSEENAEFYLMDFVMHLCRLAYGQRFLDLDHKAKDVNIVKYVELTEAIYCEAYEDLWKFIFNIWEPFCEQEKIQSNIPFEKFRGWKSLLDRSFHFYAELEEAARERFKELKAV